MSTQTTTRKHARIIASLRNQRLDVRIGIMTLADYHRLVDQTAQTLAAEGAQLPADVVKWGR